MGTVRRYHPLSFALLLTLHVSGAALHHGEEPSRSSHDNLLFRAADG